MSLRPSGRAELRRRSFKPSVAVWALVNMASNTAICHDVVRAHGALFPVLQQLCGHAKLSMLHNASWSLSNICHGLSQSNSEQVKLAHPVVRQLIHSQDDVVLKTSGSWSFLCYYYLQLISKCLIDHQALPYLLNLLTTNQTKGIQPEVFRIISNIMAGNKEQIQVVS
nr:unnamed protein product [Digitaria exilis]